MTDLINEPAVEVGEPAAPTPTGRAHALSRRRLLQVGAVGSAAVGFASASQLLRANLATRGLLSPRGVLEAGGVAFADALYTEVFPTSPLILHPFNDALTIPKALRPVPRSEYSTWKNPPGPGVGQQNSLGNETHQMWVDNPRVLATNGKPVDPLVYKIDVKVDQHAFTTSRVRPIKSDGTLAQAFGPNGNPLALDPADQSVALPNSTIYSFNGTFPGSRINAEYGQPALVRFENHLEENPANLTRQDFGTEDLSFLIHLHNGHTAPESDGNPHYSMTAGPKAHGYAPTAKANGVPFAYVDNLYLNWPAGGDDREKQSFFWFHDHRMDQTGSNVYKGMVGLFPIYDPKPLGSSGMTDGGDETQGYRLPGVRTNNGDGSFDVEYDIPLALYDCRLDDGTTVHHDIHDSEYADPAGIFNVPPNKTHPEWWGKTFFKHFPNHGFVGDIFTVNGTAFPVLEVKRRRYRLRFLDASISRIYELKLMTSTQGPKSAVSLGYQGTDLEGQYRIEDGQQCMKWTQVASDGGLVPFPFERDSFELWPAKRREFVVDFSKYMDGHPTKKGDVIYLTDVMKMPDGRMWSNSSRFSPDPKYKIPLMKIVIGDDAPDNSVDPLTTGKLRDLPPLPSNWQSLLDDRLIFEVQRGSAGGELEWLINGVPFDPFNNTPSLKNPAGHANPANQPKDSFNLWEIRNGGGGWVHPFHLHMEEHRTVMRNGKVEINADGTQKADPGHPEDGSREDLAALDPSESVIVYRGFRDFVGPYVAHCHNLAHEDHAMMFGWSITDKKP